MEKKRPVGQPKKEDAKQHIKFRLHPEVIKIIKSQPNQAAFIEQIVLEHNKLK